jgi:hypothetical protein
VLVPSDGQKRLPPLERTARSRRGHEPSRQRRMVGAHRSASWGPSDDMGAAREADACAAAAPVACDRSASRRTLWLAAGLLAALSVPSASAAASPHGPLSRTSSGSAPSSPAGSARDVRLLEGPVFPHAMETRREAAARQARQPMGLRRATSYCAHLSEVSSAEDVVHGSGNAMHVTPRENWEYRARGDPNSKLYTRLQTGLYQSEIEW